MLRAEFAVRGLAAIDVQGRELVMRPRSMSSGLQHVAAVRLREVADGLLDAWVEISDVSIGSFEVDYPEDGEELMNLARAACDGTLETRANLIGSGGTLAWPGGRWSTGGLSTHLISRRIEIGPYPGIQ